MGLFESNYKASAKTEIEREIREIEERGKVGNIEMQFTSCSSNINFAEKIGLINQVQAEEFNRKLREQKILQKTELRDDIVDDFENPKERTKRYLKMENYNREIAKEKENSPISPKESTPNRDTNERERFQKYN